MQQTAMSLARLPLTPPAPAKRNFNLQEHSTFLGTKLDVERCHLWRQEEKRSGAMVVEAKKRGGAGWMQKQRQRQPPPLPKLEDDGNPKFIIFTRMENINLWYPLTVVTGGTTAKIMVSAKDNFLGKHIYKDTIARNLAAVIYKDEKEIQKIAYRQFRVLRSAKSLRYGYKLVEDNNLRLALTTSDVIEEWDVVSLLLADATPYSLQPLYLFHVVSVNMVSNISYFSFLQRKNLRRLLTKSRISLGMLQIMQKNHLERLCLLMHHLAMNLNEKLIEQRADWRLIREWYLCKPCRAFLPLLPTPMRVACQERS